MLFISTVIFLHEAYKRKSVLYFCAGWLKSHNLVRCPYPAIQRDSFKEREREREKSAPLMGSSDFLFKAKNLFFLSLVHAQ